jgi:hypothetical protein
MTNSKFLKILRQFYSHCIVTDGTNRKHLFKNSFFFKSISTYIETRFDDTVQCDPMIHFIANLYRLYCLLVVFFNCKVE